MKEIFKRHDNGDGGWIIDFKYLQMIREDIEREDGDLLQAEEIEQILCAAERVGIPSKMDTRIAELEKQLTFRKEEDEIIRSMLQKQESEIVELRKQVRELKGKK